VTGTDEFEESDDIPTGRKARVPSDSLTAKLAEAAKHGKAFSRTAPAHVIDELRKDLGSAAVRAEYDVTTATAHLDNGHHKLTFTAKRKATTPLAAPAPAGKDAKK
jgi:hypothetical protein